ncbi:MAG TPA: 6,7-dimethyl-8-ribityllumazine synthase [Phycisphaerae bacterium]|nr:6,7-dimethyl-8-ribityllumazine synthase [Phycisphaerae bacterium]
METVTGDLFVKPGSRFALVVAEFNSFITMQLAEGAVQCLLRHGAKAEQIAQILVPGAFELPTVAKAAAKSGRYAAVICIACVIRGATDHYEHVAGQVARGVGAIGPETGVPTVFGVITADTQEQALDRAGLKMGNAGWNAALAAISTASVLAKIKATE